jgi:hypothetical protein
MPKCVCVCVCVCTLQRDKNNHVWTEKYYFVPQRLLKGSRRVATRQRGHYAGVCSCGVPWHMRATMQGVACSCTVSATTPLNSPFQYASPATTNRDQRGLAQTPGPPTPVDTRLMVWRRGRRYPHSTPPERAHWLRGSRLGWCETYWAMGSRRRSSYL